MRAFVPATGDQFESEAKELRQLVGELALELRRLSELLCTDQQHVCASCGAHRRSHAAAVPSEDIEAANVRQINGRGAR